MQDRLHVVYILTRSDTIGGVQVHVRDLARSLVSQGHEATVLMGGVGRYMNDLDRHGVSYRSIPHLMRNISPWHDWRALQEVRALLIELHPTLVSTHTSKAGYLGRLAANSLGIPVLFTAHGWAFTEGIPLHRAMLYCSLERYVASRCRSLLINVSEHDRQLGIQHRIADPKRLITIHNGVADIPYEWRANPAKQPPRLVMVARFAEQKDHETLLAALHHLKDKPWTLDLIGEGPKRAMITQSVADLGLAHRVRFFGECDDVAQQLAQAQLFLLISLWEGFPRSTLEAMRAGLPVIVSDVGGASEAIQEGKTGYVVARGNVAQLTDRLATLLDSPELRAQMGEAGRQRYAREYTLDHLFSRMMDVYQQVTKREETKEYALAA